MSIWLIALAAFLGGLAAAILGFLESHEPFSPRKFGQSVVMAVLAAVGLALAYKLSNGATSRDLLLVFLSGAGWDVISNRAIGAVRVR